MKFLYILIALLIGIAIVYVITNDANAPVNTDEATPETMTESDTTTETEVSTESDNALLEGELEGEVTTTNENEGDTGALKTFDVAGVNFAFDVEEIKVQEGDTVTINFESAEGFHDWVVDEFAAATAKVNPEDGTTSVTFVADAAGTYEYYCSVGEHRANGMVGTLIVE